MLHLSLSLSPLFILSLSLFHTHHCIAHKGGQFALTLTPRSSKFTQINPGQSESYRFPEHPFLVVFGPATIVAEEANTPKTSCRNDVLNCGPSTLST